MREDNVPEPLICLLQTLFGVVVGVFACFEFVERSYSGFLYSWAWAATGLLCLRWAWNGIAGLLERRALPLTTLVVAVVLGGLLAIPGPGLSHRYQQSYEARTWEQVKDSLDAVLWQNRYTKRVPEPYRRKGWESRYAMAVCSYSVQQKEYTSLGWYGQQAFREHPEKYDDQARAKIAETFSSVFKRANDHIQRQNKGDRAVQASFSKLLSTVAEKPGVAILWKVELASNFPDSVAADAKDEMNALVFTKLQRDLNRFYSSHLLRFWLPVDQPEKAKKDDFVALVRGEIKGQNYNWSLVVYPGSEAGLKPLFRFQWSDEKRPVANDPLVPFRVSCKAFAKAFAEKVGLEAEPERSP